MNYIDFWQQVSVYSILVPLVTGLVVLKYLDHASKAVLGLLIIAAIPQLGFAVIPGFLKNITYNLYSIVEYIFWSWLFYVNSSMVWIRRIIILLLLIFLGLTIQLTVVEGGLSKRFFNELQCLNSMVQVILVLFYYYNLSRGDRELQLQYEPLFWFTMAILLYAPSTYFYFVFYNEIRVHHMYTETRLIHNVLNALHYVIIAAGMYINRKSKTLNTPHVLS